MMTAISLFITLLSVSACSPKTAEIALVSGGKSSYVIVLPADATKNETRAATVLQQYIKQISKATLPVIKEDAYGKQPAIFIGNTGNITQFNTGKIKNEGFLIASDSQDLYISGGSGKGVVYGVYTFLETYLGCRKYANVPATVPTSSTIRIPAQLRDMQAPAFLYRETYYPSAFDNEYLEWHKLHRFEDLWGLWGHSFFKLLPPKTYFSTHPEYYALVNGRRQASQLCLSNEAVFNIATAHFREAIAENPDALYWSIGAEDGGGFCTCDLCSKADAEEGGPQGSLIRFVNRIAAQFPEQQFTTLAYLYTSRPPLKTKPAPNVYIMLSSIDAERHEALETISSAAGFRKNLEGWSAVTDNIFLWDYTTQFTNYLAPFPDYALQQPNLRFLAGKVKGIFLQGSGDTYGDMAEYKSYLQAKLLWNPTVPTGELETDFFNGYYGKAGPFIQQYTKALTATMQRTKSRLDIYGNPVAHHTDYLSPVAIDQYALLLDKAEQAAQNDRVHNARLPLEYTVLQQSLFFGTEKNGYLVPANNGNEYTVNPAWPERVRKFVAQCKQAGVRELSEGGGSPDDYLKEWETLFARKWVASLAFRARVTLQHPYAPEYPAKKEQTLTDGLEGTKDFSTNWLFMYGKDLVATIDLGVSKPVGKVMMNFLHDPRHYIFNPAKIVIETSADGITFTTVAQQQPGLSAEEDYTVRIDPFRFSFPLTQARYIRVTGVCLPAVPAWRGAPASKLPSLCCDEVYVQ